MKKIIIRLVCFVCLIVVAFTSTADTPLSAKELYDQVHGSIYRITSGSYSGSAVAIAKDILVTNCHVLAHNDVLRINGERKLLNIINHDHKDIDICFLYVPDINMKPVQIRKSSDVSIGETVYAIGNPAGFEKTISKGIISNKHHLAKGTVLQTDAAISPGSSGGGLFDENGNLIGITTKRAIAGNSLGFAAPSEPIISVASKSQKFPKRIFNDESKKFYQLLHIIDKYDPDFKNPKLISDLKECANSGNIYCAETAGGYYYNKQSYALAYHFLVKSSGLRGSSSDYYLGTMFKEGLGVDKDLDKAWVYFKKAALLGDPEAARDIGYAYINLVMAENKTVEEQKQINSNLFRGYSWIKVSEALGAETYTYDGEEGPITDLLEVLESQIDKHDMSLEDAKETAFEICSHIDRCVL